LKVEQKSPTVACSSRRAIHSLATAAL